MGHLGWNKLQPTLWNICKKANVRERLAVSKQTAQKFEVEGFNLSKLNVIYVRKQY
jgi:hypothetical protein